MKSLGMILVLLIAAHLCDGQSTPQEITRKFFDVYKQGDTDKAVDYLFSNSPYVKDIQESLEEIKRKLRKHVELIGKYYGFDLLTTRSAGPNAIMFTYLVRYDREPLIFNMMYYRPNDKWHMYIFKYGSSLDDELEEASKAYRMKENFE